MKEMLVGGGTYAHMLLRVVVLAVDANFGFAFAFASGA